MSRESLVQVIGVVVALATIVMTVFALIDIFTT